MNICIFCHDAYMSGATLALYDWISCDKCNNYLIVLPHENRKSPFYDLNNVRVVNGHYYMVVKDFKRISFIHKIKKIVKIIYNLTYRKYYRKELEKKIKSWNPNIIISNSFTILDGVEVANDLGIEHIWHIREFMELDHQIRHYNMKKVGKLAHKSHAIFISKVIKNYYVDKYDFLSNTVIYDQVKVPINNEKRKYFANDTIRVMSVGILQPNKGHLEAVKIVEAVKQKGYKVQLDIYGEGDYRKELNSYIMNHRIKYVNLKGYCNNLDKKRKNYDICLICSKNEAFGRVTIESMAAKNITIASNTGASTELIENKRNGFLYSLGNIEECSNLIIDIYNNYEQVDKIVEDAYLIAYKKFGRPIYNTIIDYINKINSI